MLAFIYVNNVQSLLYVLVSMLDRGIVWHRCKIFTNQLHLCKSIICDMTLFLNFHQQI